ncbi:hypothetical protein BC938DRAFT_473804, partial [Jimgerdemannia flammicorona]
MPKEKSRRLPKNCARLSFMLDNINTVSFQTFYEKFRGSLKDKAQANRLYKSTLRSVRSRLPDSGIVDKKLAEFEYDPFAYSIMNIKDWIKTQETIDFWNPGALMPPYTTGEKAWSLQLTPSDVSKNPRPTKHQKTEDFCDLHQGVTDNSTISNASTLISSASASASVSTIDTFTPSTSASVSAIDAFAPSTLALASTIDAFTSSTSASVSTINAFTSSTSASASAIDVFAPSTSASAKEYYSLCVEVNNNDAMSNATNFMEDKLSGEIDDDELVMTVSSNTFFNAFVSAIESVRKLPFGDRSMMYYRVLDLRSLPLVADKYDYRAVNFLSKHAMKIVKQRADFAVSDFFKPLKSVGILLNILQKHFLIFVLHFYQLDTTYLINLCKRMRVDGSTGLLRQLAQNLAAKTIVWRPVLVTLEKLFKEELTITGPEEDRETVGDNVEMIAEDLKSIDAEDEEVQWVFHVLNESIRILRSGFLNTSLTERDVDMNCIKHFLDILWDIIHLHYGEGESRASRNRRVENNGQMGDRFDWLISCYPIFPDGIRGIELGIAENSGPNHTDGSDKAQTDLVKVIKTARDQLSQIIRTIYNIYGSEQLSEPLARGIKSLFIIAIHVVGLEIHAYIIYYIDGNLFAAAEIGHVRTPHSMDSLHEALDTCCLVLRIKALILRSIKLVQALLTEAKLTKRSTSVTARLDQGHIAELSTPTKS